MTHLKAYIHKLEIRSVSLYIMLSMILQLGGLANLIIGISTAVSGDSAKAENKIGKFDSWYQRRNSEVSATT
jgi:succinate-acetate transporter protein